MVKTIFWFMIGLWTLQVLCLVAAYYYDQIVDVLSAAADWVTEGIRR